MEIQIRAGFSDPEGELLVVPERPDWRRISIQRRREIVGEMVRVCDECELGQAEAWRSRVAGPPVLVIGYAYSEPRGEVAFTGVRTGLPVASSKDSR
ncbi:MAG: hypothetical protein ACR2ND_08565 [Solirubrobacteraceae bacterium]